MPGSGPSDALEQVERWFFENDEFAGKMEKFAQDNCDIFSLDSTEQKLEYTQVYKKFKELFETELEAFVKTLGMAPQDFYKLAMEESSKSEEEGSLSCLRWIIATSDYEIFLQMMQDEKRRKLGPKY
eukprot:RCo031584